MQTVFLLQVFAKGLTSQSNALMMPRFMTGVSIWADLGKAESFADGKRKLPSIFVAWQFVKKDVS